MKLWDKGIPINKRIENFTIGRDRELDLLLAKYDILGTIAHIIMLEKIELITGDELIRLRNELKAIYKQIEKGHFVIDEGIEDVHSQIEFLITQKVGEAGKKIHSARSRNDQVLLDIKLYSRAKLLDVADSVNRLFLTLIDLSEKHKDKLMPGYTHLQVAMPSSFGLWFGAYAESLSDDLHLLAAAYKIVNQNPLGSAAGYGSSFPIDRDLTTKLLGFDTMNYNVVYAQMGRGKTERAVTAALGLIASTISKLAYDACLFMNQNFGFVSLPDEFTTGSSIMPHKKNPDVFELIRAKCNKIQALANEMTLISNNLTSGYFRDYQILKEQYLESFDSLIDCMDIAKYALQKIRIKEDILENDLYKYVFSVEELNKEVLKGKPFREAYKLVGERIQKGDFSPDKKINHVHAGSIGNLCNNEIKKKFTSAFTFFNRGEIEKSEKELLN
ncbi:MAG: argininosuccinate lyase [Bacteroidales bacterium]|nr:argininosuccinate lyase [Bacteroidales bacterium]